MAADRPFRNDRGNGIDRDFLAILGAGRSSFIFAGFARAVLMFQPASLRPRRR